MPIDKIFSNLFSANNLTYPVNVGRNIARESALTHFVLASDIELYPNPGLIQSFLKMIKNTNQEGQIYNVFDSNPKAYVVSIFEIEEGHQLPQTKNELINLMDQETLIPFHQRYCKLCHQIPGAEDWKKLSGKYHLDDQKWQFWTERRDLVTKDYNQSDFREVLRWGVSLVKQDTIENVS